MPEFSEEMRSEMISGIINDAELIRDHARMLYNGVQPQAIYAQLEHMSYVTEQLRLKLKMLGAPRISW